MKIEWNPEKVTEEIEKQAMAKLELCGEIVAAKAKIKVPKRTRALEKTIRVVRLKGDPKLDVRIYAGNNKKRKEGGVYYAGWVERGTVNMKKQPFLRPALNESKGVIKTIMGIK